MKLTIGPIEAFAIILAASALFMGSLWLIVEGMDKFRAWRFNKRQARLQELDEAFRLGFQEAVGVYGRLQEFRVRLVTPDRPVDPYTVLVRREIEKLIRGQE